ncbi:MAG TPA: Rieske (2Fe-2S) protein [Thermomicrobiales bacterium]|nr:Rieske (2Fe-2S) protein [Thermomicrobiales bacterium]
MAHSPIPPDAGSDAADRAALAAARAHWQALQARQLASRRRALQWVIRIGAAAFAIAFALPALALKTLTRETHGIAAGDRLVYATGDQAGMPVLLNAIAAGTAAQAFPEGKTNSADNLVELVQLGPGTDAAHLVAYSAICTHLGCTVLAKLNARGDIACPCHGSIYDPAAGAKVIAGPAPRPLPSLPIRVGPDGALVANGTFSGPVGPI